MSAELPEHVQQNIDAVAELREQTENNRTRHERWVYGLADALAKPAMFYALFLAIVLWIAINERLIASGHAPIDAPPFFWLQGSLAIYAALITTLVLIRQAVQSRNEDRRAHIEFHVNLLAEQKATKVIALLEELRRDLPNVKDRTDSVADALQTSVDPKLVDDAIK